MSLLEQLEEISDNTTVATIEEGSGQTSVASTAGTTNAVNIVIDVGREVIVDDVSD